MPSTAPERLGTRLLGAHADPGQCGQRVHLSCAGRAVPPPLAVFQAEGRACAEQHRACRAGGKYGPRVNSMAASAGLPGSTDGATDGARLAWRGLMPPVLLSCSDCIHCKPRNVRRQGGPAPPYAPRGQDVQPAVLRQRSGHPSWVHVRQMLAASQRLAASGERRSKSFMAIHGKAISGVNQCRTTARVSEFVIDRPSRYLSPLPTHDRNRPAGGGKPASRQRGRE